MAAVFEGNTRAVALRSMHAVPSGCVMSVERAQANPRMCYSVTLQEEGSAARWHSCLHIMVAR